MEAETLVRPVVEGVGLRARRRRVPARIGPKDPPRLVDRDAGLDLDTIAELAEKVSRRLDVEGFAPGPYALEVSSPGIERPLKRPRDFERQVGEQVKVKTTTPVDGRDEHHGRAGRGRRRGHRDRRRRRRAARPLRRHRVGPHGRRLGCRAEGEHTMNAEMIAALARARTREGHRVRDDPRRPRGGHGLRLQDVVEAGEPRRRRRVRRRSARSIDPETGDLRIWLQELEEVEVEHEGELARRARRSR